MVRKIKVLDEVLARPTIDDVVIAPLEVSLNRCTVRDLIRFRVEQEAARGVDTLLRTMVPHASTSAPTEVSLNSDSTNKRAFSAVHDAVEMHSPEEQLNAAIQQANDAFRANTFVLFLNDQQAEDLDDEVVTSELDQVTFVRLIPLQGG